MQPRGTLLPAVPDRLVLAVVVTATKDVLAKLALVGKDLTEYSLETVKMFYNDARAAGFDLIGKAAA